MDQTHRAGADEPVAAHIKEISDGIGLLVKDHLELAKIELKASATKVVRDVGISAAGAFLALIGFVLLLFAASYAIGGALGHTSLGFLIVGGVLAGAGAAAAMIFSKKLKTTDKPSLENTTRELQRDKAFLQRVGHIVRRDQHA